MQRFLFRTLMCSLVLFLAGFILPSIAAAPASAGAPVVQPRQEQPTPTPTQEAGAAPSPTLESTTEPIPVAESQPQLAVLPVAWDQALVSDGQFVWGPNVGDFDIAGFLAGRASPLLPYANIVEVNASYAGLNPRVLLAALEVRYGLVSALSETLDAESLAILIEETSMALHQAFYEHLYQWGSRADPAAAPSRPSIALADGVNLQVAAGTTSGSYALAAVLGTELPAIQAEPLLSAETQGGFGAVFASFFPDVDPLDVSNDINPPALPPDDLFQFPFPLDASWRFSGVHSWAGGDYGSDRSSMDFSTPWEDFPNYP
ncbi:MAG: hypothetical protein E4H37_08770 [Gemmatimonadales bacterium]|nr:MAG: hypothetical protein E4H37_08770 [Gemmatimonadales bacterium]